MDNFKLRKVKLTDELGVEATYHEKMIKDGEVFWVEKTIKSTIHRNPDLDAVAKRLKIHVARIFGLLAIGMYKEDVDFNEQERTLLEGVLESIKIKGWTLSGEDDRAGILVTATRTILKNKTVVLNTPNMLFADESYMFCYELGEISKDLLEEVYQYLFKRKFYQLQMALDTAAPAEEEASSSNEAGTAEHTSEAEAPQSEDAPQGESNDSSPEVTEETSEAGGLSVEGAEEGKQEEDL